VNLRLPGLTCRDRDGMPGHIWAGIKNHATPPIRRRRGFWSARCGLVLLAGGFDPVAR
jgi:hypothetical protein